MSEIKTGYLFRRMEKVERDGRVRVETGWEQYETLANNLDRRIVS